MGRVNKEVKASFYIYSELRKDRKTVLLSPIDVSKVKARHPALKIGHANVTHETVKKSLNFEVEVKISNCKDFKFKLFCSELFGSPFFRFDSCGASHRNNDPEIPLKEQLVTTPHFHQYNEKGIEIAYKTAALLSELQLQQLEDINVCVMHFCEEGNMRYQKNDFPEVNLQMGELGFKFTDDDPLKNVGF
jgi:hypothetical protein